MSEETNETSNASDKKKSETAAPPVKTQDPQTPVNAAPETAAKAPAGESGAEKPADAKSAAAAKPAAAAGAEKPAAAAKPAATAPAEPPPPPPPGEFGKHLEVAELPFTPLGDDAAGVEMMAVPVADILRVAEFLRDKHGFDLLLSASGIDWKDRLETVYHAYGTASKKYIALKVTAVDEHSPSLMPVWPAADWHERESYDLVGIKYDGHPNLSRILMPSDWLGHPLRKDYKVDDPRLVWNER